MDESLAPTLLQMGSEQRNSQFLSTESNDLDIQGDDHHQSVYRCMLAPPDLGDMVGWIEPRTDLLCSEFACFPRVLPVWVNMGFQSIDILY